jgi:dTDP-4-amino-4,6-dideoxygalactose transaminase
VIGLYPKFSTGIKKNLTNNFFLNLEKLYGFKVYPFSSARAALLFSLKALDFKRTDEVLIPKFMSDCVVSAISKTAFPSLVVTPKTKAIYVFHQFGYNQDIRYIEKEAKKNGWVLINCCVHSLFNKFNDNWLVELGDFTILSFPKFYPCGLGGGLVTKNEKILDKIHSVYLDCYKSHKEWSNKAYQSLRRVHTNRIIDSQFHIESVYGYLPNVVSFPDAAFNGLPNKLEAIKSSISIRKKMLKATNFFLKDLKKQNLEEIVPFGIPLDTKNNDVLKFLSKFKKNSVEIQSLHFDYNQNMLNSDYQKTLVIGCHEDWIKLI